MSTVLQVPDVNQFSAFSKGDEQALTAFYRTQYDALLANATESLGPDLAHFGARTVEQAMLITWAKRAEFTDGIALVAGLSETLGNETATQKRKHSALHHGHAAAASKSHAAAPTADQAVDHLMAALHAPPVDHAQMMNEAKAASKLHAAEHVQKVGKSGGWKGPVALVVVAGVAIIAFMRWADATGSDYAATKALQSSEARAVSASRGQRGKSTLNDGSIARIGSDTKIKIPSAFGTTLRTLEVAGTASFTVAAGQPLEFVVRAGNAIVTAKGTVFAVRAFEDDSTAFVSVDSGSVSVKAKDESNDTPLEAGKALRVNKDGTIALIDESTRDQAFAWTRDSLVYTDVPVGVILPELNRWFDTKAKLGDDALGARKITLRVGLSSSGEALKLLAAAASLKIGFDKDDRVVLGDDPKPASAPAKPAGKATKK
jgi:ferric-dicitrate binding protein FerR (iron transport regulator)